MKKAKYYIHFLNDYHDPISNITYNPFIRPSVNEEDSLFYIHNYDNGLPPLKVPKDLENIAYKIEEVKGNRYN